MLSPHCCCYCAVAITSASIDVSIFQPKTPLYIDVWSGDDVDGYQLSHPLGGSSSRFNGNLHGGKVAPDQRGGESGADFLVTFDFDVCGLDHRIRSLCRSDQSTRFNQPECSFQVSTFYETRG